MKTIRIVSKYKTKLLQALEERYSLEYPLIQNFFQKLFSKQNFEADLFFYSQSTQEDIKNYLENAKVIIANSNGQKELIMNKHNIDHKKIEIIYPYVQKNKEYEEEIKNSFRKKYNLKEDERILFFTANDLNSSGVLQFIKFIHALEQKNYKVLIEGSKKQMDQLKLQINRMKVEFQIILLEDYENKDELFIASDIFVLPTKQKGFQPNILKAMYYKNAVLIPQDNFTSEVVDGFSIMNGTQDPSVTFKIDALLDNPLELEQIQNLNSHNSTAFSLESRISLLNSIIENKLI